MNVRTVCLSILHTGPATGYEIRRLCVEGECSYFVEASFGSIYPALAKLEDDGLVSSHVEQQDGKPSKKVYSITKAGHEAFVQALCEPLGEEVFRSPFLLFARFAHLLPAELVQTRLAEHLERAVEARKNLNDAVEHEDLGASDCWVVNYGLSVMEVAERYVRTHMHDLITLAKAETTKKDAAE